jgi:uncharacterized membrane protein
MGETNRGYEKRSESGEGTDRLQFFSDAVFAIAMTLLVIDITLPLVKPVTAGNVWKALLEEWPSLLAYALSFLVISLAWRGHHSKFRYIKRYDGRLITLNLLLLFFIAFVPFPTSVISEFGDLVPSVVLYAAVVAIITIIQPAMWVYAYRAKLTDESVDAGYFAWVFRNELSTPIVFLLSIPVAFLWNARAAMFFWILSWPLSVIIGRYEPRVRADRSVR